MSPKKTPSDDKVWIGLVCLGANVFLGLATIVINVIDFYFENCQHLPEINTAIGILLLTVKISLMCNQGTEDAVSPIWGTVILSFVEIVLEFFLGGKYGVENAWNSLGVYNAIVILVDLVILVVSIICECISLGKNDGHGYKKLKQRV